ncbi:MAG TPA: 5,6-dimethylbenzimidazole synthase [Pirellulales bacterium]|nr:5,6-dimethylbenzimidazole synthase [Pirellulales bacterium]
MDVYEAIYTRRDVRQFRSDTVPDDVLARMLDAAHHAGSVGFMQPWNFIIIRDMQTRRQVRELFDRANAQAACHYVGARRELYDSLKLEGILESALNLCVTCDRSRGGHVLGRDSIPDTDLYSTCCAVQNLWLAARAEGVGVGWVSIVDPSHLAELLQLPEAVVPVAYLCVGYPRELGERPMLEEVGWRRRLRLDEVVFEECWGRKKA